MVSHPQPRASGRLALVLAGLLLQVGGGIGMAAEARFSANMQISAPFLVAATGKVAATGAADLRMNDRTLAVFSVSGEPGMPVTGSLPDADLYAHPFQRGPLPRLSAFPQGVDGREPISLEQWQLSGNRADSGTARFDTKGRLPDLRVTTETPVTVSKERSTLYGSITFRIAYQ
ncbi:MAG: hypothetical protein OEY97_07265 [Nitrospirota bacterium]|nr:hypothetical protein [Nitrospirota bacterium]